jgi:excisionase family DNA binding protein
MWRRPRRLAGHVVARDRQNRDGPAVGKLRIVKELAKEPSGWAGVRLKAMDMPSPWVDVEGAARYAAVSATTIRRAAAGGELRAYRIAGGRLLRFRVDDVDRWMTRSPLCENLGK